MHIFDAILREWVERENLPNLTVDRYDHSSFVTECSLFVYGGKKTKHGRHLNEASFERIQLEIAPDTLDGYDFGDSWKYFAFTEKKEPMVVI